MFEDDDKAFKQFIQSTYDEYVSNKHTASELSKDNNALVANLKQKGISPTAFKMICTYIGMDPDERRNFDISIEILRRTMGLDAQAEMFDASGNPNGSENGKDDSPPPAKARPEKAKTQHPTTG